MTPEVTTPSPNFLTTPMGRHLSLHRFNVQWLLYTVDLQLEYYCLWRNQDLNVYVGPASYQTNTGVASPECVLHRNSSEALLGTPLRFSCMGTGVASLGWAPHQNSLRALFRGSLTFDDFLLTHVGAPVAWGLRIIDTVVPKPLELLEPVGPRYVIYTKTRLTTPSTDQSSRRQPLRKKCTRTANCFIGHHPGTGRTFTRGLCVLEPYEGAWLKDICDRGGPLRVLPLTPTHRRLRLEWYRARENWTAAELNQVVFSDDSRFNLGSDDNRVRVWRSRGERLNPAFVLQRHAAPTAGVMFTETGNSKCDSNSQSAGKKAGQNRTSEEEEKEEMKLEENLAEDIENLLPSFTEEKDTMS
ncbi:uncharacterized protein TNCV_1106021 [Trichonephila clavipes]|nr:uncharacterized protein TNCV_1106021 [Trichonephila clavipes]